MGTNLFLTGLALVVFAWIPPQVMKQGSEVPIWAKGAVVFSFLAGAALMIVGIFVGIWS